MGVTLPAWQDVFSPCARKNEPVMSTTKQHSELDSYEGIQQAISAFDVSGRRG